MRFARLGRPAESPFRDGRRAPFRGDCADTEGALSKVVRLRPSRRRKTAQGPLRSEDVPIDQLPDITDDDLDRRTEDVAFSLGGELQGAIIEAEDRGDAAEVLRLKTLRDTEAFDRAVRRISCRHHSQHE